MSDADEIVAELRRNTLAVRELADEVKRLREMAEKVIAIEPKAKKDRVEDTLEALVPFAAGLLRGGRKPKR